ncbi:hypothetical protein D9619_004748 [Psilocybe cf. subviscida]|uniref:Fork-head domain-containing protein n=1 Tax=Psilocybe cf. subviscida TaxID=2480587 RepID=A0A8H5BPR5_9AGAR|nr:hypothetical protein D9619_004748 [Psilocybe cf. subviscida]
MSSYSTSSMPSPPMPYLTLSEDHLVYTSDPECSSPDPHYFPEPMPSPALSAVSHVSSSLLVRSAYEQQLHDEQLRSSLKLGSLPLNLSALPLRFPRARSRKNGGLVRYPIIHIISLAIRGSPRQALTLSQIYETVEENLASYRPVSGETARDKAKRIQWQSSVRHSLSLQFMFVQVDRLPDDAEEKLRGNYWTLDPSKYGLSRRSVNLEEKKKAMAAVAQKKKSASPPRKTSPARRRSRARKSLSPAPQHQRDQLWPLPSYISHVSQPHPQRYEPYELAQYPISPTLRWPIPETSPTFLPWIFLVSTLS